jgi:dextranase
MKLIFRSIVCSLYLVPLYFILSACNTIDPKNDPITYGESYIPYMMNTDKAAYKPGETVRLTINSLPEQALTVRYTHLGKTLKEEPLSSKSWSWQPPAEDFQGYMAELHATVNGKDSVFASIGIDVSSEPKRFPRNGFLSSYGAMSSSEINTVLNDLNRYHINYVQFQDWHWKHHHPLAGSATQPMDVWTDIISRNCYRTTVQSYIDGAHQRGMLTLFYNLGYGCLEDFATDNVSREWLLYTDKQHAKIDNHPLGSPFKSAIYLADMHQQGWRDYLRERNDEVYAIFHFDGWQIDQLGARPTAVYDYAGNEVDVQSAFGAFIANEKKAQPDKRIVMNAVGQYGQQGQIASAPVDFCYTEVWEHSNTKGYTIFSDIITNNASWSSGKQTVLAAYLNYDYGQKGRGYFNTPGIIMATAVASAWGGTILQMGEHMLCHEYFPDDNLSMTGELKRAMIRYYDFAVAYENLLRPEAPSAGINSDWFGVDITSTHDSCVFNQWGPQIGQIATVGRHVGSRDVIHLLSYRHATHLDWCDSDGDQAPQTMLKEIPLSFAATKQPERIWVASPDYRHGAPQELEFEYTGGKVTLTIPALQYWTMVVVEKK